MSNVWFTSDQHFFHNNVIKYCNRPFETVEEMNATMIANWNAVVAKGDSVYMLGDFAFVNKTAQAEAIIGQLNGHIHWVYGNHDAKIKGAKGVAWAGDYKEVKHMGYKFVCCHYPMVTWNGCHRGTIMLHGHCHGTLPDDGRLLRFDVGVDSFNFTPVSGDVLIEMAEARKAANNGAIIALDNV